jgi:type I restriction enzyme, S subunit
MSDQLPKGWTATKLSEIVTARKGKKPAVLRDSPADGFLPYLDIHAIEKNIVRQFAEVESSKIASKDDLFVVWDGARSGWIGGGITGAIGSTIMALTAQQVESCYLRQFIASQFQTLNTNTRGTGIPHVDPEVFWNLDVPLAPLAEQRRIVAKLEKLLGRVDTCKQRLAKMPKLLKRFRQSVLAAACSGRLTADWREENPGQFAKTLVDEISERRKELWRAQRKAKGIEAKPVDYSEPVKPSGEFEFDVPEAWNMCSMDALTSIITSGSRDWKQYYRDRAPGTFVMAQNIRPLRFDRSYRLAVAPPENDRDRTRSEVFKDDLLVTIVGANTGDSCRVPEKLSEHYVCQSVALMRPVLAETSRFLELFLNSAAHGLAEFRKWIYGEGRPHLSFDNLRETLICLPSLPEQQEIVRRVDSLFALADQLEARLARAHEQVDKLTPSLLARAFAGKLVPQDPNDEPASALLERIARIKTKT